MNEYTVYIHTFPNGKKYIGITRQNVKKRWGYGTGYNQQVVGKAIKKYGWKNIKHEIVKDNLSQEEACLLEQKLIKKYKTNQQEYGYNLSIGGDIGKKNTYMCENAIEFINKFSDRWVLDYQTIFKKWKYICQDELEAKVFNNAYNFVDKSIKKLENRIIDDNIKIVAIDIYLEAWENDWIPQCAEYNVLYLLNNYEEIIYNIINGEKDTDYWKKKIPI